jgi:biotin synthase-related radical SAM superfamily protein
MASNRKGKEMDLKTKAALISYGEVQLSQQQPQGRISTAGPGAGGNSIFFRSGKHLVRLSVAPRAPLRLVQLDKGTALLQGDRELARGELVEPLQHCPEQAYLTVSERCIYNCKFCAVPKLQGRVKALAQVMNLVEQARETGHLKAISLTSGVAVSPEEEVVKVAEMTRELQRFGVPIGVSVCPAPGANRILRNAGAVEVKYNLETSDRDLFARVCPGLSFQAIMDALAEAVLVFGRNRVYSNIIVGLGESDRSLRQIVDELTELGVMPILRAVYPHPLRLGEATMERPSAERLLSLSRYLRRALDRQELRGDLALTGCYLCTGCDLVPHRDL